MNEFAKDAGHDNVYLVHDAAAAASTIIKAIASFEHHSYQTCCYNFYLDVK